MMQWVAKLKGEWNDEATFMSFELNKNDAMSLFIRQTSKGYDKNRPKGKKKYKIPFVVKISVAAVKLTLPHNSVPNSASIQREILSKGGFSPPIDLKVDSSKSRMLRSSTWLTCANKSCRVRISVDLVRTDDIPDPADFIPYIQWPPMVIKTEKSRVQLMLEENEWSGTIVQKVN